MCHLASLMGLKWIFVTVTSNIINTIKFAIHLINNYHKYHWPGPVFCFMVGVSSGCARPITGQVTSVTWPVIGWAESELTLSKRQKTGPGIHILTENQIIYSVTTKRSKQTSSFTLSSSSFVGFFFFFSLSLSFFFSILAARWNMPFWSKLQSRNITMPEPIARFGQKTLVFWWYFQMHYDDW